MAKGIEVGLTRLEAKAPEGNGVFLMLIQRGESLEDFDRS
jgi:hypothetical protein